MRRRPEPPRRKRLAADPFEAPVERQIKVEPGLFAIRDHIQTGVQLITHGDTGGIILQFLQVFTPKFGESPGGVFEPGGEWIASDY